MNQGLLYRLRIGSVNRLVPTRGREVQRAAVERSKAQAARRADDLDPVDFLCPAKTPQPDALNSGRKLERARNDVLRRVTPRLICSGPRYPDNRSEQPVEKVQGV